MRESFPLEDEQVIPQSERNAWRSKPQSPRSPSFFSKSLASTRMGGDEEPYLEKLKKDQLRVEAQLLSNDLENIEATYVMLDEQLKEFHRAGRKLEKEAREEALRFYAERKEAFLEAHASEMEGLRAELRCAELAQKEATEHSARTFKDLCVFLDLRKANLRANFEKSAQEKRDALESEHQKLIKQLQQRCEEVSVRLREAAEERRGHVDALSKIQRKLQNYPQQARKALEEEHRLILAEQLKEMRALHRVTVAPLAQQLQEQREECAQLRELTAKPLLEKEAEQLVRGVLAELERRNAEILREDERAHEARVEELNSVNAQLSKDVEKMKLKRRETEERQAKERAAAEAKAEAAHQREVAVLVEETDKLNNDIAEAECDLLMLDKTKRQSLRLLRQKSSHEAIHHIESQIAKSTDRASRERLELTLRWERNKARIFCLHEQAGSIEEVGEDELNEKIRSLQTELNTLKETLDFEQLRLDASQDAWRQTFSNQSSFNSPRNSDVLYFLK